MRRAGELKWTRDLAAEFEAPKGWFGRCCAPLVADDRVLVNVGGRHEGKPAGVAAFAVADGTLLWTGSTDEASYSSPILTKLQGGERAVFFTRKGLEVLEPATGRSCFKTVFEPDIAASVSACTPVVCGANRIFLSGCYGMGARLWTALPDGAGNYVERRGPTRLPLRHTGVFRRPSLWVPRPAGGRTGTPLPLSRRRRREVEPASARRHGDGRRSHAGRAHREGGIAPRSGRSHGSNQPAVDRSLGP